MYDCAIRYSDDDFKKVIYCAALHKRMFPLAIRRWSLLICPKLHILEIQFSIPFKNMKNIKIKMASYVRKIFSVSYCLSEQNIILPRQCHVLVVTSWCPKPEYKKTISKLFYFIFWLILAPHTRGPARSCFLHWPFVLCTVPPYCQH